MGALYFRLAYLQLLEYALQFARPTGSVTTGGSWLEALYVMLAELHSVVAVAGGNFAAPRVAPRGRGLF